MLRATGRASSGNGKIITAKTGKRRESSCEAQWRASKLKYMLYRRALQQVFDDVQSYNRRTESMFGATSPPTAFSTTRTWRIVSPESSLARLNGCDGYIAQVWTGTARNAQLCTRARSRTHV